MHAIHQEKLISKPRKLRMLLLLGLAGGDAMPAFGAVLEDAEIKNLIGYLESLKPRPKHARKRGTA